MALHKIGYTLIKTLRTYLAFCLLLFAFHNGLSQKYQERITDLEDSAYEHFYTNKDSTYFYFDKIIDLALANNQVAMAIDNLNYVCFSAGYFYDLEKIRSTIELTDELMKKNSHVLDTLPDNGDFQKNYLNFNKGNYYYKLEDYKKATSYFDSVVRRIVFKPNYEDDVDNLELLSQCYNFIAQMSAREKRYVTANDYYEKNIRLFQQYIPEDLEGLYKVYNLYANSLFKEEKYEKAKNLWLTYLNFGEKNYSQRNRNSIVTTALLLSKAYLDLDKIDSASYYLKKIDKYKMKDDPFKDRYFIARGEIYQKQNNYTKALETFKNAINVSLENDKPQLRKKIGDLYLEMADTENALRSYQQGIIELSSGFNSPALSNNPDPAAVKQKNILLTLLGAKSKVMSTLQGSNNKASVLASVNTGLETLDLLKPSFKSHIDKLSLIEDTFTLFETGIATGYQLKEIEPGKDGINTAFRYMEKSKSVLLLEAIFSVKASQFSNIPDAILEKERQIKSEITFIEKQLIEATSTDTAKEDQLFELQENHRQLITKIETNYKTYYDLKYNTNTVALVEMQKRLNNDEQLISYFYGNDAIYAIAIGKTSKRMHRIPFDSSLEREIKQMHQMLGNAKSDLGILNKTSYSLYKKLVAPFTASKERKKLIIIADGLLNYIPFGALNTAENGVSYLMESHTISYTNSATLYAQLKDRKKKNGNLLAFAPKFSGEQVQVDPSRDKLLPLPHNTTEVEQILNSFKGQAYINENASLQNFTSQLYNYGMLHLATHAVFNDTAPEYSYLAFSSADNKENLLYVSDLYNLQIDADLVTLSACETGVGELKRGEGFLSLARGFFYSGASSIASTLWKINDASTSTLMDSFYKNMSDGDAKDVALQKSQLSFLQFNKENGLSHPYYWSGFIISGNTEPLTSTNYWSWIGLGVLFFTVAGFLFFRKKTES